MTRPIPLPVLFIATLMMAVGSWCWWRQVPAVGPFTSAPQQYVGNGGMTPEPEPWPQGPCPEGQRWVGEMYPSKTTYSCGDPKMRACPEEATCVTTLDDLGHLAAATSTWAWGTGWQAGDVCQPNSTCPPAVSGETGSTVFTLDSIYKATTTSGLSIGFLEDDRSELVLKSDGSGELVVRGKVLCWIEKRGKRVDCDNWNAAVRELMVMLMHSGTRWEHRERKTLEDWFRAVEERKR